MVTGFEVKDLKYEHYSWSFRQKFAQKLAHSPSIKWHIRINWCPLKKGNDHPFGHKMTRAIRWSSRMLPQDNTEKNWWPVICDHKLAPFFSESLHVGQVCVDTIHRQKLLKKFSRVRVEADSRCVSQNWLPTLQQKCEVKKPNKTPQQKLASLERSHIPPWQNRKIIDFNSFGQKWQGYVILRDRSQQKITSKMGDVQTGRSKQEEVKLPAEGLELRGLELWMLVVTWCFGAWRVYRCIQKETPVL